MIRNNRTYLENSINKKRVSYRKPPYFWWIVGSLVFIIIALVSVIVVFYFCDVCCYKIIDFTSVFSVFLSIILSVFAILYTYTSNNEIARQFEKINSSAEAIKHAADDTQSASRKLDGNLNEILNHLVKIHSITDDLKANYGKSELANSHQSIYRPKRY